MKNKQLSEMIKTLRKKKLAEIVGKPESFKPEHPEKSKKEEDPGSPNQYIHRMAEENLDEVLGGTYHKRITNKFKARLKPSQRTWTKDGQQSMKKGKRYTAEQEEKKLGPTATGQPGETVSSHPKDTTFSANKNTTVKETKEK
jgi:hypothetical protein